MLMLRWRMKPAHNQRLPHADKTGESTQISMPNDLRKAVTRATYRRC